MFSYNIWHYVQKYISNLCNITNTKTLHRCRSYPSYHPDPIPYNAPQSYNPTALSHIIHKAIIYYTPYNHISIMYIYHTAITYLSNIIYSIISLYHILCNQIYYCYALYYYILYQYAYNPIQLITRI